MPQTGQPVIDPTLEELADDTGSGGWIVTVFDNDYNTWDEVVSILITATGCGLDEAQMETWEVHHLGRSVVHHGSETVCNKAAQVISTIGIRVTVSEE